MEKVMNCPRWIRKWQIEIAFFGGGRNPRWEICSFRRRVSECHFNFRFVTSNHATLSHPALLRIHLSPLHSIKIVFGLFWPVFVPPSFSKTKKINETSAEAKKLIVFNSELLFRVLVEQSKTTFLAEHPVSHLRQKRSWAKSLNNCDRRKTHSQLN